MFFLVFAFSGPPAFSCGLGLSRFLPPLWVFCRSRFWLGSFAAALLHFRLSPSAETRRANTALPDKKSGHTRERHPSLQTSELRWSGVPGLPTSRPPTTHSVVVCFELWPLVCFPPARASLGTPACGTSAPASPLFVDTWSSGRTPPRTVSTVGYSTVPPRRRATLTHTFLFRPCFLGLETCGLGSCPTVTTPPSPRVPTCSSRDTWRLFLPAGFPFTCGPRKTPRCPPSFLTGFGRPPPPLQRDGTPTTTRCPFLSLPTSACSSCSVPSLRSCLPTVSFPYWLCVSPPGATRTYFFTEGA